MTAACFDSDVLIDYLDNVPMAVEELGRYTEHHVSIVSWVEIMTGAARKGIETEVRRFLDQCQVHDLTRDVAERAVALRMRHRLRTPDASIWATAIHLGLVLITRNTRDFPTGDPGIRVPYRI